MVLVLSRQSQPLPGATESSHWRPGGRGTVTVTGAVVEEVPTFRTVTVLVPVTPAVRTSVAPVAKMSMSTPASDEIATAVSFERLRSPTVVAVARVPVSVASDSSTLTVVVSSTESPGSSW